MLKIGLLSDTHGYIDPAVKKHFKGVDEIWHAGDIGNIETADFLARFKPLRAVYGNIDDHKVRRCYPESLNFEVEKVKVTMIHIGGYPGKYPQIISKILDKSVPNLFICGHSHILKVIYDDKRDLLHINPGAAGKNGFHKVRTLIRFTLDNGNIKDLEVIELNPRYPK